MKKPEYNFKEAMRRVKLRGEPKRRDFSIRLDIQLWLEFKRLCKRNKVKAPQILEDFIRRSLEEESGE